MLPVCIHYIIQHILRPNPHSTRVFPATMLCELCRVKNQAKLAEIPGKSPSLGYERVN